MKPRVKRLNVGIIGFGYWGPNLARNFDHAPECRVRWISDLSAESRAAARKKFPQALVGSDSIKVLDDPTVDAVAIATPASTHFAIAKAALIRGKHILVEKPFVLRSDEARELIRLGRAKRLTVAVGHTFLFSSAVRSIRSMIRRKTLGRLNYYDATRISLGNFQKDVNVVWDLAPHDVAIMDHLIAARPTGVSACGRGHFSDGRVNTAFITFYYPGNMIAHINVNWMAPCKIRSVLIGGNKRMLLWDDTKVDEKIKIYDNGVHFSSAAREKMVSVQYRRGDMLSPRLDQTEALHEEVCHFLDCIRTGRRPINDGESGFRVVRILEGVDASIGRSGACVQI